MIVHICDFCGFETDGGDSIPEHWVTIAPTMSKKWAKDHDAERNVRVHCLIGIDGINPEPHHNGNDLCLECQIKVLHTLADLLGERS